MPEYMHSFLTITFTIFWKFWQIFPRKIKTSRKVSVNVGRNSWPISTGPANDCRTNSKHFQTRKFWAKSWQMSAPVPRVDKRPQISPPHRFGDKFSCSPPIIDYISLIIMLVVKFCLKTFLLVKCCKNRKYKKPENE